jgi:putative transposase
VHAVHRGHNKEAVFFDDLDYLEYLRCLKQAADACMCGIHAYVLMSNHVHLLLTPEQPDSIGRLFQSMGRHYVRHINSTYQKRGALWEGRYKCNIVQSQSYLLACMRYIEMNPVRAGVTSHPALYRWSSYVANALGVSNAILTAHPEYLALGAAPAERRSVYQGLFGSQLDADQLTLLRSALQTGTPLGNDKFRDQIEAALGRKVGLMRRGRPKKGGESA